MKNWRVDYAFRVGGEYAEGFLSVIAPSAMGAINEANSILFGEAYRYNWDINNEGERFIIWNVGIVAEGDEEVF